MWWRQTNAEWKSSSAAERYEGLDALTRAGGSPPGLLGFLGDEPVAWVNVAPRRDLARLESSRSIPAPPDAASLWAVPCVVVGKAHRGKGFAVEMLAAAVERAAAQGAPAIEGYPVATEGARISAASAYTGTVEMFRAAGFDIAGETTSRAAGHRRVVMRRTL